MTPEDRRKLNELYDWMNQKKRQQVSFPLDEASRNSILESGGLFVPKSLGSFGTQTIDTSGASADVPAQPSGTLVVTWQGVDYELLYK